MTPSRPYLLRAFYEWIIDNNATPYIVVNADFPQVIVPREYVDNGRIVINISPGAVRQLLVANDHVEFNARFAGVAHDIYVPMRAVSAIYAKENGRGMVFKEDEDNDVPPDAPKEEASGDSKGSKGSKGGKGKKGGNGRPKLTIVK